MPPLQCPASTWECDGAWWANASEPLPPSGRRDKMSCDYKKGPVPPHIQPWTACVLRSATEWNGAPSSPPKTKESTTWVAYAPVLRVPQHTRCVCVKPVSTARVRSGRLLHPPHASLTCRTWPYRVGSPARSAPPSKKPNDTQYCVLAAVFLFSTQPSRISPFPTA
jgi:hypothetical protein